MNAIRPSPDDRLPVAVVTGFLGSGKSSLLNRLLKTPAMMGTAVIVNEFGEIGIDHALIETAQEDTILLDSGCLCCSSHGDLARALRGLLDRRGKHAGRSIRRIVIETTGLADPAPVLIMLMSDPLIVARCRLTAVATTVDAVNGWRTLDAHMEAVEQVASATRLIVTKTDLAAEAEIVRLAARLQRLNRAAPIARRAADSAVPADLFDGDGFDTGRDGPEARAWLAADTYEAGGGDKGDAGHDRASRAAHRHDARIRSFCLTYDTPFEWDQLAAWLDSLAIHRGDDLLRMKGLINIAGSDRPAVIHGVQRLFHPPVWLPTWPDADRRSRIVFITRDLDRATVEIALAAGSPAARPAVALVL
ncbi:MAG: GTP-binding protein [Rhodospirillales bacterium]|nr:GTP-binding protein [Rhodospirillales bacterium]